MLFTGTCQNAEISTFQKSRSNRHKEEGSLLPICSWHESHPSRQQKPTHSTTENSVHPLKPPYPAHAQERALKDMSNLVLPQKRLRMLPPNQPHDCFTCPASSNQPQIHICALSVFSSWLKRLKWNQAHCKLVLKASLAPEYRSPLEMSTASSLLSETRFWHFPTSPRAAAKPKSLWDINNFSWPTLVEWLPPSLSNLEIHYTKFLTVYWQAVQFPRTVQHAWPHHRETNIFFSSTKEIQSKRTHLFPSIWVYLYHLQETDFARHFQSCFAADFLDLHLKNPERIYKSSILWLWTTWWINIIVYPNFQKYLLNTGNALLLWMCNVATGLS